MKIFRNPTMSAPEVKPAAPGVQRLTRRSSGLRELARLLQSEEPLCVLDLGSTSAANIRYLTERGHKIYSEDLLEASTDPSLVTKDESGHRTLDSKRFLDENLVYPSSHFDVVMCWNISD